MLNEFKAAPITSITLCNSAHPVLEYIDAMVAKPVPNKPGLFYVKGKDDKFIITYRKCDNSIAYWDFSFSEFKRAITNGHITTDVYEVGSTDKYIGDAILRMLQ